MRSDSKRKANKIKVIIVTDEQEIPDGYVPVSGAVTNGQSLTIALPEKVVRESIELIKEINELRAEAITTSSELMFSSKQSEVVKLVESRGLGLIESVEPPKKIIVEK